VSPSPPQPLVDVVSGPAEVARAAKELHVTAHEQVLRFETALSHEAASSGGDANVRVRAVFERAAISGPDGADIVRRCHAAAWEPRIAATLPLSMIVADEHGALLPLDPVANEALLIRTPAVVAALRALFEHVWSQSITLSRPGGRADLSEAQQRLLELMAAGMKDETIARHLGTSVRTLRRHVTAIEEKVGVDNRVALAVVAVRRGWLH
jgi:DNA-binding CsgD family transcriptional regulator